MILINEFDLHIIIRTFEFQSQELCDAVFKANWNMLSISAVKQLLLINQRALRPIIVSTGHFVVLSLESFTKVCFK